MHEENKLLPLLYSLFLGLLLALFVGIGVSTFYKAPIQPEYPIMLQTDKEFTPKQQAADRKFNADMKVYNDSLPSYNRNVSIITLAASVILLVVSMLFSKRLKVIADGIMLGGLFTLLYSVGRGFASQDNSYTFIALSVGLVVVLYIGYTRFIVASIPVKKPKTAKKSR